ncbi:hypothetical protein ACEPAF_9712 [Sanghuangporus sanghuang]
MDGGAPLTIFKRSKARTARTRSVTPADNTPENDEETVTPSTLASKLKKQHKERNKPKARLSFGGDDEEGDGETFQVKKSNLSRKLKLAPSVASGTALFGGLDSTQATPQTSNVIYSKEYLSELKASTQSAPSPSPLPDNNAAESEMLLDASEMSGAIIVDDESTSALATEIPSESSIVAAKQRRERLRKTAATNQDDNDFISLSVTRREDLYQGPHPESRLMREDDDLGEGDDEFAEYTAAQERIALGKKSRKKEAANRRVAMQELIEDAEEEEETAEWEREQLRRGTRQVSDLVNGHTAKQEYRPAKIPEPTPLPSLDAAISRLSDSLTQLTLSHTSTTTSMSTLADERVVLEGKEKEMRTMVENAESKRSWFSSFREWVETVATFLDEKYPRLEELEEEHLSLLRERNDMTTKRRSLDDEDDLDLFIGPLPSKDKKLPEAFDELGRVILSGTSDATRKDRRKARATRHSHHAHPQEEEGYSTDSSLLPSDEADYQAALSSLRDKVSSVLFDVRSDEFRDPSKGVARWFAAWRDKYSDTYSGAFGGLGMVSAWEFWVRLEMLGWDPVSEPRPLDSFTWFSALYDYSRPVGANGSPEEDGDNAEPSLGPDGDLASAMLSTIVPRLCKIIRGGAFDPYSSEHVRAIIDLAEQVEASASHEKLELLQKTVYGTFRQAIDDHATLIQPYLEVRGNSRFDPEAIPARQRFLYRRFKLLNNFLRWRKYTGEKFGAGEMVLRLVNQCMRPIAETGWEVGGERIMEKAMNVLPPDIRRSL